MFDALLRDFGNGWPFPWKNRREAHTSCPSARHPAKIPQDLRRSLFFFQISTYRITDYRPKGFDLQICLLLPKDCEILRTRNIQHLSINAHSSEPQRLTFSAFFLMEEQIHGHRSCQHHSILRCSIHQGFPVNIHHLEHQQRWELICALLWIQWFLAHNPLGVGGLILHLQVPGDKQPKRSRDANIICFLIHR